MPLKDVKLSQHVGMYSSPLSNFGSFHNDLGTYSLFGIPSGPQESEGFNESIAFNVSDTAIEPTSHW